MMTAADRVRARPAQPGAPGSIPIEIHDVVAFVAREIAMSSEALLGGVDEKAARGRRLAAALAARRNRMSAATAARLFGMGEALVKHALMTLDDLLAFTQLSVTHAPLATLAVRLAAEWERFEARVDRRVSVAQIQATVAAVFGVSVLDLKSRRRSHDIVLPRHVAMHLARVHTGIRGSAIALAFDRERSAIAHAMRKIAPYAKAVGLRLAPDATIEAWARALMQELGGNDAGKLSPSSDRAASASEPE